MKTFLGRNEHHVRLMKLSEFKNWTYKLSLNLTDLKNLLEITFEDDKRKHIFNLRMNYKNI